MNKAKEGSEGWKFDNDTAYRYVISLKRLWRAQWRRDHSLEMRLEAAYGGERGVPVTGGEPPLRGVKRCFS
jgi:hypothetical protein